jgi:hypothetical protein
MLAHQDWAGVSPHASILPDRNPAGNLVRQDFILPPADFFGIGFSGFENKKGRPLPERQRRQQPPFIFIL